MEKELKPKYQLVEPTSEEQELFMEKFNELLNQMNMYFEPVPQIRRDDVYSPWKIVCEVLLQKKVEIKEDSNESDKKN